MRPRELFRMFHKGEHENLLTSVGEKSAPLRKPFHIILCVRGTYFVKQRYVHTYMKPKLYIFLYT